MNVTTTTRTISEQAQLARDAQQFAARQIAGYLLLSRIASHTDNLSAHKLIYSIRLELAKQMDWDVYRIASDVDSQLYIARAEVL